MIDFTNEIFGGEWPAKGNQWHSFWIFLKHTVAASVFPSVIDEYSIYKYLLIDFNYYMWEHLTNPHQQCDIIVID